MKNQIKFDPEDARLSAYALGELQGEERALVEALLAESEEARALVDELRATAETLTSDLAGEPALTLTPEQRASIVRRARPALRRWVWAGAIAAGILAVSGIAYFTQIRGERAELASKDSFGRDFEVGQTPPAKSGHSGGGGTYRGPGDSTATPTGGAAAPAVEDMIERNVNAQPSPDPVSLQFSTGGGGPGPDAASARASRGWAGGLSGNKARPGSAIAPGQEEAVRENIVVSAGADVLDIATKPDEDIGGNTEGYNPIVENAFKLSTQDPLSTFSIDVDTASYANVRRFLTAGTLPPPDAVRVEELLNYFHYDYPRADGERPFSVSANVATCPWAPTHKLVQIGLRGQDIDLTQRQPSNLVFLIDVSGSMDEPDKLPLLVDSMKLLIGQLDGRDKLSIVVYAGSSGLVLPATTCDYKTVLMNALDALQAGGSTNGGAGIELAYKVAAENLIKDGQNRVVLCTDGDFNVGTTDQGSLVRLIEEKRQSGVFLSVLGFGTGNTKDSTMEMLADKGNGNYAYVDTLNEARKVLVHEMGGTLFTIAKDVKIQVEFNPAQVQAWRLIGYENRVLAHQDFNDDKKDAGEIGAGHNVTALYEVVPAGVAFDVQGVDALRYQVQPQATGASFSGELLNLKLRYKPPTSDVSTLIETPIRDPGKSWQEASPDFKFAAAVAGFGLVLRKSANVGSFTLQDALNLAVQGVGEDVGGYRKEFVELVKRASEITVAKSGEKR